MSRGGKKRAVGNPLLPSPAPNKQQKREAPGGGNQETHGDGPGPSQASATQPIMRQGGRQPPPPGKIFNDPIHGQIEMHPLLVKIIDTPQFQRLRKIKQMGGAYFVYPGASHNRFEHSIGVGHLAGELVKALKSRQRELDITDRDVRELEITDRDVLCVQIAGLCHDLGHGPFSHLFDQMFIPEATNGKDKWKHEKASIDMFKYMVEKNGLESEMEKYGLELEEDLVFIEELIDGDMTPKTPWPYKGRPAEKSFLYEIVANKLNGIDVDKFDYFSRDCHHLGIQKNFDHLRFIMFARVCDCEDKMKHICSRDKEVGNLYDLFHMRYRLHSRACQHKVNENIQIMICDALLKADQSIEIKGSGGKMYSLSGAIKDMEAYTQLTDEVLGKIQDSTCQEEGMEQARQIIQRINSRDLYTFLGEAKSEKSKEFLVFETIESLKKTLAKLIPEAQKAQTCFEVQKKTEQMEVEIPKETIKSLKLAELILEVEKAHECIKVLTELTEAEISEKTIKSLKDQLESNLIPESQNADDYFKVTHVTLDYGMKDEDPIKHTYFYKKNELFGTKLSKDQVSSLLPERFSEQIIRVYWKNKDEDQCQKAKKCFKSWCKAKGFQMKGEPQETPESSTR